MAHCKTVIYTFLTQTYSKLLILILGKTTACTVRCSSQNTSHRVWDVFCGFKLVLILPQSIQWCMQYHVILDLVIKSLDCISAPWSQQLSTCYMAVTFTILWRVWLLAQFKYKQTLVQSVIEKVGWGSSADSRFSPSQWDTSSQSNTVSHWLGPNLESVLGFCGHAERYKQVATLQRGSQ